MPIISRFSANEILEATDYSFQWFSSFIEVTYDFYLFASISNNTKRISVLYLCWNDSTKVEVRAPFCNG